MTEVQVEPPTPVQDIPDRHGCVHASITHANGEDTPRLTPRNRSPQPSIGSESTDIDWYDDTNEDYEWIKMPKSRDYDIFRVPRLTPERRNTANVPLIARMHNGNDAVMWAKMDTGADANIINASTLKTLLGDNAEIRLHPLTIKDEAFHIIGDNQIHVTHSIDLDFVAGRSRRQFKKIRFMVMRDEAEKSRRDGVPDVILGNDTLQEHSMVMIDLDYHVEADPGLPVIAERAEHEAGTIRTIGPIKKFPTAPPIRTTR